MMKRTLLVYLLLITPAFAVDLVWEPKAPDVAQRTTIDLGGTWAAGETVTPTINNKDVIVTGGSTADTPEEYAAFLVEAITRNEHDDDNTQLDYAINSGGYEFGEFRDVTARIDPDDSTIVWVESAAPGVPFTMTVSETSASGTVTVTSDGTGDSVLATGKHHFDNSENWSTGSLPTDDDRIIFRNSAVSVLYGLDNTAEDLRLLTYETYVGSIGLPKVNRTASSETYEEYRQRFLDLPLTATTGSGDSLIRSNAGIIRVDFGTNDPNRLLLVVESTGAAQQDGEPVQIVGGNDLELTVYSGSVSVGDHADENTTNLLKVRTAGQKANVKLGEWCTFDNAADSMQVDGGLVTMECDCSGANCEARVYNGTLLADAGADFNDLIIYGGKVNFQGVTIATLYGYGGEFDASMNPDATGTAITNEPELFKGFVYKDPKNIFNKAVDLNGARWNEVKIHSSPNLRWTPSDPGTVDAK